MNIVFVNDSSRIAGAEKSLALLAANLPRDRFRPTVVCPPGEFEGYLRQAGIESVVPTRLHHYNRSNGVFRYGASLTRLARILVRSKADIVHCNSYRAAHWGIPLAYLLRIRAVCHVRDCHYTRFSSRLMAHAGGRVFFIAVSEAVKNSLIRAGVRAERIKVVYNGADVTQYHPGVKPAGLFSRRGTEFRLGLFGRIEERKRHIDAVEALPLIRREYPNVHLVIVGDPWRESGQAADRRLKKRIAELNLQEHVTFTGYRTDVPALMADVDAVLVPSVDEPFARVILEAFSLGKPVIGTLSGGTPEMIEEGVSGILTPPEDPAALAAACLRLIRNPEIAAAMGRQGRKRALRLFTIDSHVGAVTQVYLECGKQERAAGEGRHAAPASLEK
jgi:glycosyltransferase involved in cell wall biosynthesis